jgi:hypothetical protein
MEAGKISVIYMGLVPGPNKADNICGKMKVMGTMQRSSTVFGSKTSKLKSCVLDLGGL